MQRLRDRFVYVLIYLSSNVIGDRVSPPFGAKFNPAIPCQVAEAGTEQA